MLRSESLVYLRRPQCSVDNRACLIVSHLFIWGDPSVQWLVEPAPVGVTCLVEATPVFSGQ